MYLDEHPHTGRVELLLGRTDRVFWITYSKEYEMHIDRLSHADDMKVEAKNPQPQIDCF